MTLTASLPDSKNPLIDEQNWISLFWYRWMLAVNGALQAGYSGTIVTAALTGPGAQGSMTFVNGVLTAQTPAT